MTWTLTCLSNTLKPEFTHILEENKMICDIIGQHTKKLACIKKIYHPLYGESLLSAAQDNTIKLWII